MAEWYEGKEPNPAFRKAIDEHLDEHYGCMAVSRTPHMSTLKAHNAWRRQVQNHIGGTLPPTFLEPARIKVNRNASKAQGNWAADKRVVD